MRIKLTSVYVDDQDKALKFYIEVLGFQKKQGLPLTTFFVDDIRKEAERMKQQGVVFTMEPTTVGPTTVAIFDDTCGNLIQLTQV